METGLKGKIIMVAAASRGLGYGVARACALEGARLSISSRSAEAIDAAAGTLAQETGVEVLAMPCDASDGAAIEAWRDATLERFGGVDGLLVNAGGPPPGKFDDFGDADWQAAFDLTLMSAIRMIRAVLPSMRERGGGAIVTSTSSSVKEPIDVLLLSNVMRAGVVALAKSLSRELAGDGIRVNNLVPGRIQTDRVAALDRAAAARQGITEEEARRASESQIPLGRHGTIDEYGKAGAFLLSDAASYITGETLIVDGGSMRTVW